MGAASEFLATPSTVARVCYNRRTLVEAFPVGRIGRQGIWTTRPFRAHGFWAT